MTKVADELEVTAGATRIRCTFLSAELEKSDVKKVTGGRDCAAYLKKPFRFD